VRLVPGMKFVESVFSNIQWPVISFQ
jgi:hypothetical protein